MYRKPTLLALAAAATLGLSLSGAIAGPMVDLSKGQWQKANVKPSMVDLSKGKWQKANVKPFFPAHPKPGPFFKHPGWYPPKHHHWQARWQPIYPRPIYRTYAAAAPVVTAAAPPASCLSKEYTPQGAVLFKDNCTNEWAMNPPAQ